MHQRSKIAFAAALALGTLAGAASAQQASPQQIERVEITGSRIRQVDSETAQPVEKITAEAIQRTGLVTLGDVLNQLTSAGTPDFSKGSVLTSNREQGGQYINLRNLGSQRLLVLLNGKRWTQSVDGYTDISTIPSALVDHIDVLKDGASSIYGSDAIAGVVNVVLKKSLDGGKLSLYYGANEKGDGQAQDASLAYGISSDKGSLMFSVNVNKTDPVWAKDRAITAASYGPDPDRFSSSFGTGPWGRIRQVGPKGTAVGFNQYLNHTGTYLGEGTGSASNNPANYHTYAGALNDTFNSTSQMMFQGENEQKSFFVKGNLDITPDIRFNSTAMFSERKSVGQVAGYPLNSLSQPNFPVYVDKDSYYNPYGNQVAGAGNGQNLFFYRRTVEVPRVTSNTNRTTHLDAGLEGDFSLLGNPWTWDVGVNFSKQDGTVLSTGNLNLQHLKAALGPSFKNADGVVQCGTAASPIPLTQCTPFDILGGPSASTPAAIDYVMAKLNSQYGSTTKSATANVSGELFKLPAGAVGIAAGFEYRTQEGYDLPDELAHSGLSTDLAGNATRGNYNVKEAYAELNVPLLKKVPMAELLSLNLASRYSDYSNFGNTTNSKVSFMWKPITDVLARGTWAQGFRAPPVGNTFGGGQQSFDSYLDPCDTANGAAKTDAAVLARCNAGGTPAGYRQTVQSGAFVGGGGGQGIYPFNASLGNGGLTPEKATTKTLGVVYNPSWLAGLETGLDWYNVKVKNAISAYSAGDILNRCYVQGISSFCSSITRDAAGMVATLSRGYANLAELETAGLDLSVNYRFKTSYGQFYVRTETSFVTKYRRQDQPGADFVSYLGEYGYNRVKSNLSLTWNNGPWTATWGTRYYSKVKDQCWDSENEPQTCTNPAGSASWGTGYNVQSALFYHDLSVGYTTPWKGQIMVGANNVLDKKPRVVLNANYTLGGNSSSSAVDPDLPIDRFLWVRYNQPF
ncbi:MAG: TonB-dependent receptor [Mitsuaria chitosanitabida]|uniref:TonB-dependent receptor domain-containing protein n=1 Tax=Roseateles chitosanitabidus TaxID=65048 RepID=UPI001B0E1AE9|nr:TonB-dependent receptor [Roseateles chitosanitabidus]MBO9686525.1 TonB-dependent receptor [Roseateles chitosanitabidus]